ncbi:PQQ-binding-like beta-propeller repeat protein [Plantactinospora sp. ZYX-F-223]|uniref:outer membrane protein assembly factor BamB family protein n=1 Tax=Plantactinospora sp. ZYX-F-223 TaxID=3144103 RepID=UPI0031FBA717
MAKGSARSAGVMSALAIALIAVIVLAATNVWNPFPGVWDWVNRDEPISEPDVVWQQRIGGTPQSVTIAGNTVVIRYRTRVEARSLATGLRLWERKADWAAVAGGDRDAVVAVGKLLSKGYELLDPETGAVRRKDSAAVGVWTYRNALVDVRCREPRDCTLTAWDPRGSNPSWTTFLPGVETGPLAGNPDTLGTRPLTTRQVHEGAGGPVEMPPLLGLSVDGRVHIVDTATGRVMQDVKPGQQDRIVVVGGRMLRIEARAADGTCYFTVVARDPVTGQEVWRRDGLNLRTADGAGCVQREDPQGGENVFVGVGPDARETVVDAYDGRVLWTGPKGEKLLAVDDRYALSRSADQRSVVGSELAIDRARWTRPVNSEGGAALARHAALLIDRRPNRIIALDPRSGRELANVRSSAEVLAVGPAGMVIGDGRDIGYLQFAGVSTGGPAPTAGPGGQEPGPGTECGGPKQPECPPENGKDG